MLFFYLLVLLTVHVGIGEADQLWVGAAAVPLLMSMRGQQSVTAWGVERCLRACMEGSRARSIVTSEIWEFQTRRHYIFKEGNLFYGNLKNKVGEKQGEIIKCIDLFFFVFFFVFFFLRKTAWQLWYKIPCDRCAAEAPLGQWVF